MRLGTKSCAECRRRKVRCIYLPNNPICKECTLHEVFCIPQTKTARQSRHLTESSLDGENGMRQRLEELEGIVRNLCQAINTNTDSSSPGQLEISADALKHLRQATTPEPKSDASSHGAYSMDKSELDTSNDPSESMESFEDAPLLNLFKATMFIEGNEGHADTSQEGPNARHLVEACIESLNALLPSFEDLTLVLQATEKYWSLWRAFPAEILPSSGNPQSNGVANVRNFIFDSMKSSNPIVVAKAALCLALCVQQLPSHSAKHHTNLPSFQAALLESYLVGAETLLSVNDGSAGSIDSLECLILQTKLYINMGKPRNAWLCLRRATSYALLQGLHNLSDSADERPVRIWSFIWQHDRNLSLILGLPYAVPDTHPGVVKPQASRPLPEQAFYEFSIIAGHINDRNQNRGKADYSFTEQIERELIQLKNGVGSQLLNTAPSPSMPLQTIYDLQAVKLYYHNLTKLTHLPYMLKSSSSPLDKKYEHSRFAAVSAARSMITAWQQLRDCSGDAMIICDLMDFLVFTAAIVVVLNLLSPSCPDAIHQQASDWELVHDVTRDLRHVSRGMDCNVASQAATLLQYLSAAQRGIYEGPEVYEAVIPYFGAVRISQKAAPRPMDIQKGGWGETVGWENTVEFSADEFVPFSQNYMGDYLTDAELGVDWTAVLNADIGYEWSQSFHSSSYGMA